MSTMRRRDALRALLAASSGAALGCGRPPQRPPSIPPWSPEPIPPPWTRAEISAPAKAPALVTSAGERPSIPYGVQSGDVTSRRAMIWSRADRPARMMVEWSTRASFADATRVLGPVVTPESDLCGRVDLDGLPPGQTIVYRVTFVDDGSGARSEPVIGSLRTASEAPRDVTLVWGGDTAGQGFGINLAWGGMKIFEAMRRLEPDLLVHCGDMIYADVPIRPIMQLSDGAIWTNLTTPEKSHVAETLDDFRGNFAYNLLDDNLRRFNAEVPSLVLWDDHEIRNNWFPGQVLRDDRRYTEKSASTLAARARRAMFEYTPIRAEGPEGRIYRALRLAPSVEVFALDERSYRGPNTENHQRAPSASTAFLGEAQLRWLEASVARSTATWKVIATDMPLGLLVSDSAGRGRRRFDGWANGAGPPLGRELELAALLRSWKRARVRNVVWLTADVHYAAAHRYDPARASFTEFLPFWEFVAGPFHASTFGPNPLDSTFGPEVKYQSPAAGVHLRGPADGGQYFGAVRVESRTEVMTVSLHDLTGARLYRVDLVPER
jgi:alkaline phosphatase D